MENMVNCKNIHENIHIKLLCIMFRSLYNECIMMASTEQKIRKQHIPASLKAEVWRTYIGPQYVGKCHVQWCSCAITPFDFEAGHNVPESKGGSTTISNLRPICAKCNKSMGNRMTIDEYSLTYSGQQRRESEISVRDTTPNEHTDREPNCNWFAMCGIHRRKDRRVVPLGATKGRS